MKLKQTISLVTLLACVAALVQPDPALGDSESKDWQFDVLLNGKQIGHHTFSLEAEGDRSILESEASFDVKFLFFNAFSYRHQSTEVWNEGCLQSIDAMTDSNGDKRAVLGKIDDERFELQQPQTTDLPACVQSFAYWNPAMLKSRQLLNAQTGQYEDVNLTFEAEETIEAAGERINALRYRLETRGGDITLWYSSDSQTWVGLEAPAKGGRTLSYRAKAAPLTRAELVAQGD